VYNTRANVLLCDVYISEPFNSSSIPKSPNPKKFQAIWDTGATHTAITQKVVQDCNLQPTGMTTVHTAGGEANSPTYLVSIWLPNKICIPQLRVTEANIRGADVLIGMDIVSQGDLAISTKEGKTNLSFRMPSIECIDFVQNQPKTMVTSNGKALSRVGRNDPCPCGSGKKYKRCCGKSS